MPPESCLHSGKLTGKKKKKNLSSSLCLEGYTTLQMGGYGNETTTAPSVGGEKHLTRAHGFIYADLIDLRKVLATIFSPLI